MKQFVMILGFVLTLSCVRIPVEPVSPVDPGTTERLTTHVAYDVPTKAGYTTYVTYGADTLCVAAEPTSIWIPKNLNPVVKSDGGLTVSYIEGTDPKAGSAQMWQTIAFEDSEVGDYDYNDLVIHCKYQVSSKDKKFGIGVHPIALGSSINITLGCKVFVNGVLLTEHIFTDNCRDDLFDGQEGFINTGYKADFHTNYFQENLVIEDIQTTTLSKYSVVWFIEVAGKRFYAVNNVYGYLDEGKRPYGLLFTNTGREYYFDGKTTPEGYNWFAYPFESVRIDDCYPTFNDWITGVRESCDFSIEPENAISLLDYKYTRADGKSVRIYDFPRGRNVWDID